MDQESMNEHCNNDVFLPPGEFAKHGKYLDLFEVEKHSTLGPRIHAKCSICHCERRWTLKEMKKHLTGEGSGDKLIRYCNAASPFWNECSNSD